MSFGLPPDEAKEDPKAKKAAGKDKGKDKKKGKTEEVDEGAEMTAADQELKLCLDTELDIVRYRLTAIRDWAVTRLKTYRTQAVTVYEKLLDWVIMSTKAETDSIEELLLVLKEAIEGEEKLRFELKLKGIDVIKNLKIVNYVDPPVELYPAKEEIRADRFTIAQIEGLVHEMRINAAHPNYFIDNDVLLEILARKTNTTKTFGEESGVPEEWQQFNASTHFQIIKNLDTDQNGNCDWRYLCTFICLLNSPVLSLDESKGYKDELLALSQEGKINQEDFCKVVTWFDEVEKNDYKPDSYEFDRIRPLKTLIFDINKDSETHVMDVENLLNILTAQEFDVTEKIETYYDLLMK
eukprot:CAMPEP_0115013962 /NCGR_PEP_ID=MMETSP0216-20121206/25754_1 /TAXON_ID=223996 /ORGANISM="Protocruzia adherens, Strain Boccale" /LENGTH=351 /DNA_ID=CAMNT_0002383529 /DNA_START=1 /DNA_END=1056 /DNA_ORIENTATION=-